MGQVFVFSLTAALNPTLLAAVTVMLTLSNPQRLLWLSPGGGADERHLRPPACVRVARNEDRERGKAHRQSCHRHRARRSVLVVVFVVATGRDRRRQAWSERRREKAKEKPPPRWKRTLSRGSPRDTFVIGILLSFPGASYIAGMDLLSNRTRDRRDGARRARVQRDHAALLELPLIGYLTRPESTAATVSRFNDL